MIDPSEHDFNQPRPQNGAERYWEARWRDEKAHNDVLVKALTDIIEANKDFRDGMPQNWDGDPLQDACDAAQGLLDVVGNVGQSSTVHRETET